MDIPQLKNRIQQSMGTDGGGAPAAAGPLPAYTAQKGYCAPLGPADDQLNNRTVARFAVGLARWICAEGAASDDLIAGMFDLGYPVGHIGRNSGEAGADFVAIVATACSNLRTPDCLGHAWLDAFDEPIKREQLARFAQAQGMIASVYVQGLPHPIETPSLVVYGADGKPLDGAGARALAACIDGVALDAPEVRRLTAGSPRIPEDCCDASLHAYLLRSYPSA